MFIVQALWDVEAAGDLFKSNSVYVINNRYICNRETE
jgi:hypothetical protein